MTTTTAPSYVAYAPIIDTVGPFAFTFRLFASDDMRVILRDADGVDTVLSEGSDYTLSAGPYSAGGTVTTLVPVSGTTGERLTLKSDIDDAQDTDLINGDVFDEESVETMADKMSIRLKQFNESLGRVFTLQESTDLRLALISDPTAAGDTLVYDGVGFSFVQISTYTPSNTVTSVIGRLLMVAASAEAARQAIDIDLVVRALPGGRLTGVTGDPTGEPAPSTATIYYTPYKHNRIPLYNSTLGKWISIAFAELSLSIAALTDNLPFDVFVWENGGAGGLEGVSWSTLAARATALALVDGIYTKSGAPTRRYVGTCYKVGGVVIDFNITRGIWNLYNRIAKGFSVNNDLSVGWNYSTATWRARNNDAASCFSRVCGLDNEDLVTCDVHARFINSSGTTRTAAVGIGLNNSTTNNADVTNPGSGSSFAEANCSAHARFRGQLGVRTYIPVEQGAGSDTQTWRSTTGLNRTGMLGTAES